MGLLSKLFENLKMCSAKKNVAHHFGLGHPKVLESWMHTFSNARNICAHHGRLWNRPLTQAPIIPNNTTQPFIQDKAINAHQCYAMLCCIIYAIKLISPASQFVNRLKEHINLHPSISLTDMGFPATWHDEPLWY